PTNRRRPAVLAAGRDRSEVWSAPPEARHRAPSSLAACEAVDHGSGAPGRCTSDRSASQRKWIGLPEGHRTAIFLCTDAFCGVEFNAVCDCGSWRLSAAKRTATRSRISSIHTRIHPTGTKQNAQRIRRTNMAWENAVLSDDQNRVANYPSSVLLSATASARRDSKNTKSVNDGFADIVGACGALREVLDLVRIVATTDSTVLIEGETGTGKELIARAIHEHSTRRDRPLVKLNCAAIPLGLLESELFGHERGAFTGAVARKIGRFEAADRGTLFLDEIGDIPLELQAKLLRVLQEGEFERLGRNQTQRVNVRLVAATNGDLLKLVCEKRFRSDLYYRLNVFPISVPPLRDRSEDIPLLVTHFVAKYAARIEKVIERIRAEVMDTLTFYSWPGNIRELQNFIECSVILTSGSTLCCPLARLGSGAEVNSAGEPVTLEDLNREHICRTLQ